MMVIHNFAVATLERAIVRKWQQQPQQSLRLPALGNLSESFRCRRFSWYLILLQFQVAGKKALIQNKQYERVLKVCLIHRYRYRYCYPSPAKIEYRVSRIDNRISCIRDAMGSTCAKRNKDARALQECEFI